MNERLKSYRLKFFSPDILFGVLCCAAITIRLYLLNGEDYLEDDTYITLRFARSIAEGAGYAFNPGEPVYGASSPLYTLLLSFFALISPKETLPSIALCCSIASVIFAAFVVWKLFPFGFTGKVVAVIGLLGYPRLVYSSISGMEECFVLLLMCISFAACVRKWEIVAAVSLGLLLLTKLDTTVWIGCLLAAYALHVKRFPTRLPLIALCVALPWFVYAQMVFGSVVPHTVVAKQVAFPYDDHRLVDILQALLPQGTQNATSVSVIGLVLLVVLISTTILAVKKKDFLILAFPVYCVAYSLLLMNSQTSPTLWSRWVVPLWGAIVVSIASVVDVAAEKSPGLPHALRFALPLVAAASLFSSPFLRTRSSNESGPYREVASYLQQNAEPGKSIMLEPIGLIGYESNLYVHDFVGLVTPAVTTARRASGYSNRWYIRYLETHAPTYVLLRVFEFQNNEFGYGSGYGDGIFEAQEREWFEQHYASVFVSSRPNQQNAFVLFRRRE